VFGYVFEDLKALTVGGGNRVEELACEGVAGFIDDFLQDFGLEG